MTEVHFINVGYGDAALIVTEGGGDQEFSVMIDCGGKNVGSDDCGGCRIPAAKYLAALGIGRIDVVLLSHLHLDHAGGLPAVAETVEIGELWTNYLPPESAFGQEIPFAGELDAAPENLLRSLNLYGQALERLRTRGTVFRTITSGFSRSYPIGTLKIVAGDPEALKHQREILNQVFEGSGTNGMLNELHCFINQTSLQAELNANGAVFLFTGDIEASAMEKMDVSRADVLKLPHHGHSDAINERILRQMRPSYTVISVSNTRKDNCPDLRIVKLLEQGGTRVLFTDSVRTENYPDGRKHRAISFRAADNGELTWEFVGAKFE